jgi:hypothetical protein
MEILNVQVSIIGTVLAVIANIVLGMAWYSRFLFGNIWMKLVQKKEGDLVMKKADIVLSLVVALLTATGLNSILQFSAEVTGLSLLPNVVASAGMLTLTIIVPFGLNQVIWEGRDRKLFFLNIAHHFVSYVLMGAIISYFVF